VILERTHGRWPGVLDTPTAGADCFHELDLGPGPAGITDPLADARVFEVVCP